MPDQNEELYDYLEAQTKAVNNVNSFIMAAQENERVAREQFDYDEKIKGLLSAGKLIATASGAFKNPTLYKTALLADASIKTTYAFSKTLSFFKAGEIVKGLNPLATCVELGFELWNALFAEEKPSELEEVYKKLNGMEKKLDDMAKGFSSVSRRLLDDNAQLYALTKQSAILLADIIRQRMDELKGQGTRHTDTITQLLYSLDDKLSYQLHQKFNYALTVIRHGTLTPELSTRYGNTLLVWLTNNARAPLFNGRAIYHQFKNQEARFAKQTLQALSSDLSIGFLLNYLQHQLHHTFPAHLTCEKFVNPFIWREGLQGAILLQTKSTWTLPALEELSQLHTHFTQVYDFLRKSPEIWESLYNDYLETYDSLTAYFSDENNQIISAHTLPDEENELEIQHQATARIHALSVMEHASALANLLDQLEIRKQVLLVFATHFGLDNFKLVQLDNTLLGEQAIRKLITYDSTTDYRYFFPNTSLFVWRDQIDALKNQSGLSQPRKTMIEEVIELHFTQLLVTAHAHPQELNHAYQP